MNRECGFIALDMLVMITIIRLRMIDIAPCIPPLPHVSTGPGQARRSAAVRKG